MSKTIILSSGGTGGHVFPALSLAEVLSAKKYQIMIMTDHRGHVFQQAPGIGRVISLPIWRGREGSRFSFLILLINLVISFIMALGYMIFRRPMAVVGFGGYPSIPAILAATILRIPTALHEQNAILGRANRFLARFVKQIGVSFEKVKYSEPFRDKVINTGNPVRKSIIAIQDKIYKPSEDQEPFCLFILGGSQGARIFSTVIPNALRDLPEDLRKRLTVYQQCRKELVDQTKEAYQQFGLTVHVSSFFDDVDQKLKEAHLVIGRAGASTVAELMVAGRPAILVPYPYAMDNHQQANAMSLSESQAAWVILERDFTPQKLQEILMKSMNNGNILKIMAKNMHKFSQPNAAEKLAQMVENLLINS